MSIKYIIKYSTTYICVIFFISSLTLYPAIIRAFTNVRFGSNFKRITFKLVLQIYMLNTSHGTVCRWIPQGSINYRSTYSLGNNFVSSGNKPLPETLLTLPMSPYGATRPHWYDGILFFNDSNLLRFFWMYDVYTLLVNRYIVLLCVEKRVMKCCENRILLNTSLVTVLLYVTQILTTYVISVSPKWQKCKFIYIKLSARCKISKEVRNWEISYGPTRNFSLESLL